MIYNKHKGKDRENNRKGVFMKKLSYNKQRIWQRRKDRLDASVPKKLGVPFYDKEIIDMAVEKSGLSREIERRRRELRAKRAVFL